MPTLASLYTCTGCLVCVDTCAKNALSSFMNNEGHITYKVDSSRCIECGLCEKKCPIVSCFRYGTNNLHESTPFAAWCKDNILRAKSSSGGIFAALAKYVISNGGIVIGASLQNNEVRHIFIDKIEDISKLQGSKYTQSNTAGIYKKTIQFMKEGKSVLFSGLGCQVAGLLSFVGKREFPGKLYTVDLICGGVPSRFIIDRYLESNQEVKEIAGFRNKGKYEFSIIDKIGINRVVPISERPFPLCGFYTELTNRYSCYDCKFNGAHRKSDLTIGDYWGDTDYPEQHAQGISVVVVHSEKGKEILEKSEIEAHEIEWNNFLMHNPRMIDGYKKYSNVGARRDLAKAFKNYTYEKLLQIYANKATWHEPWLMVKKILRYLKGRLYSEMYKVRLKKRIKRLHNQ